jgi:hypothetical protein
MIRPQRASGIIAQCLVVPKTSLEREVLLQKEMLEMLGLV